MTETLQPSARDMRAKELDWRALADALDQAGKHEEAAEMRRSGESVEARNKQAVIISNEQFMAQRKMQLDQEVEAARNIPRPVSDPRFAAKNHAATAKLIEQMLSGHQNKLPSAPISPKRPTPPGGK